MKAKFNLKKCFDYIEPIDDFRMDFRGEKPTFDNRTNTILVLGKSENIKAYLKKFVIQCQDKSELSTHSFLEWITGVRQHWSGQQAVVISALNESISKERGKVRTEAKKTRDKYLNFFWHNYKIIDMIVKDVMEDFENTARDNDQNPTPKPEAMNETYFVNDGVQVSSIYEYLKDTGTIERMKEKYGATINPTGNFELLKKTRSELFEEEKPKFLKERELNNVSTTESDLDQLCLSWLGNELEVIEKWLSARISTSTQIEILKYKQFVESEIEKFIGKLKGFNQGSTANPNYTLPAFKPTFKPEIIPKIMDSLKGFFNSEDNNQLIEILTSGGNVNQPLVFLSSGNRLADLFKQLFQAGFITGCQKKELEKWISTNFSYRFRNEIRLFKARYLSDIISTGKDKCQSPILNVKLSKETGEYSIIKA